MSANLTDYLKPGRFPWSDEYQNSPHAQTDHGCIVCGRRTAPGRRITVCLTGGGDVLVRPEDAEAAEHDDPGAFMGFWPVGPECGSAIPPEYRCGEVTS